MDDMDKEIAKLEHELAQLERGTYKQAAGPRGIDVLAVAKAGFRRRTRIEATAGPRPRLTHSGEQRPEPHHHGG
jgi:hypothetical protein